MKHLNVLKVKILFKITFEKNKFLIIVKRRQVPQIWELWITWCHVAIQGAQRHQRRVKNYFCSALIFLGNELEDDENVQKKLANMVTTTVAKEKKKLIFKKVHI